MDSELENLIYGPPPKTIFQYHERLIEIVVRVMGPENVRPGFQNTPQFMEFEEEIQFPTGNAMIALTRRARATLAPEELGQQRDLVRRMVDLLAREATPEELTRKCLDVSMMVCLILEELGLWAISYMGTLIYDGKQFGGKCYFYFADDVYEPPANSETRGHAWVYTPAFALVDLTAKHQPLPKPITDNTPFPLLIEDEDTKSRPEPCWYVDLREPPTLRARKMALLEQEGWNREYNQVNRPVRHRGPVDLLFIPMRATFAPTTTQRIETPMIFGGTPAMEFCERVKAELLGGAQKIVS